ncbi:uncharacterized protein LOC110203937 [Phascolarctos cinereus]|uniref:Uncharacterized protein LOC110203937 n=1 Tax=Phascolarctos cinereus TaxID=38626 RepID=A0A6P5JP83_PHACI|nr:uncharacterized protein LOC110203937 [Phascolarctos cinereus]
MEALRARVVSTLDRLSPPELEEFKFYLRSSGKKPRIPMEDLDTAPTTSALADLLLKRYVVSGTPRVLVRVFQRMRRNDLVAEWALQNIVLDVLHWWAQIPRSYQHQILQRDEKVSVLTTTLKRQYENDGPEMVTFYLSLDNVTNDHMASHSGNWLLPVGVKREICMLFHSLVQKNSTICLFPLRYHRSASDLTLQTDFMSHPFIHSLVKSIPLLDILQNQQNSTRLSPIPGVLSLFTCTSRNPWISFKTQLSCHLVPKATPFTPVVGALPV